MVERGGRGERDGVEEEEERWTGSEEAVCKREGGGERARLPGREKRGRALSQGFQTSRVPSVVLVGLVGV
jgi:hypothetical protein